LEELKIVIQNVRKLRAVAWFIAQYIQTLLQPFFELDEQLLALFIAERELHLRRFTGSVLL
jgi:hypothetical protein